MKQKSKKASLPKDKVTPLHLVKNAPCHDTVVTLEHLTELARKGECRGIAFGAILRDGRICSGYTGAAVEQSALAVGILSQVIFDIQLES